MMDFFRSNSRSSTPKPEILNSAAPESKVNNGKFNFNFSKVFTVLCNIYIICNYSIPAENLPAGPDQKFDLPQPKF